MKIKNCKWLTCICLLLVGVILLAGCDTGVSNRDEASAPATTPDQNTTESSLDTSTESIQDMSEETTSEASDQSAEKVQLDAFKDLTVTFEGASPRCTVVLNNSACSEQVRAAVTYQTDKEFYANGDTVTITAVLSQSSEETFALKDKTMACQITHMPAYYDADTTASTTFMENELRDFVNTEIGKMTQNNTLFGIGGYSPSWHYTKVESVTSSKGYLLTLKDIKQDQYGSANAPFYNSIRVVADCHAYTGGSDGERQGHIYVCFELNDVIVHPDGQISWANNTYEITYIAKVDDNTIATEGVYRWALCYDIQETAKTDWILVDPQSNN